MKKLNGKNEGGKHSFEKMVFGKKEWIYHRG